MGKTHRKIKHNDWCVHRSVFVEREAKENFYRFVRYAKKKILLTKEEIQAYEDEYNASIARYNKLLEAYEERKRIWESARMLFPYAGIRPKKPYYYIPKCKFVSVELTEEEIENAKVEAKKDAEKYYDKHFSRGHWRDGKWSETGQKSGFKNCVSRANRASTRMNIRKYFSENDFEVLDDLDWYSRKHGKSRLWDFW